MPTDAYVDESQRGARYALACVLTRAPDNAAIRSAVRQLMRPRQKRIHFHDESSADFEHRVPDAEPLLWIADGLAWAALTSPEGRQRLAAVTLRHVDLGG